MGLIAVRLQACAGTAARAACAQNVLRHGAASAIACAARLCMTASPMTDDPIRGRCGCPAPGGANRRRGNRVKPRLGSQRLAPQVDELAGGGCPPVPGSPPCEPVSPSIASGRQASVRLPRRNVDSGETAVPPTISIAAPPGPPAPILGTDGEPHAVLNEPPRARCRRCGFSAGRARS